MEQVMPLRPLPPVASPEQAEAQTPDRVTVTLAEMLDAIKSAYAQHLGVSITDTAVPEDVTSTGWHEELPAAVLDMTSDEFSQLAADKGEALAEYGLHHGLTSFAPLRIEDRPYIERRTIQGRIRTRERALIVHALGW